MSEPTPCGDDCGCPVSESETELEEVEVPLTLDLSTYIREYLEHYSDIDEDDIVTDVTVCTERVVAHIEAG